MEEKELKSSIPEYDQNLCYYNESYKLIIENDLLASSADLLNIEIDELKGKLDNFKRIKRLQKMKEKGIHKVKNKRKITCRFSGCNAEFQDLESLEIHNMICHIKPY